MLLLKIPRAFAKWFTDIRVRWVRPHIGMLILGHLTSRLAFKWTKVDLLYRAILLTWTFISRIVPTYKSKPFCLRRVGWVLSTCFFIFLWPAIFAGDIKTGGGIGATYFSLDLSSFVNGSRFEHICNIPLLSPIKCDEYVSFEYFSILPSKLVISVFSCLRISWFLVASLPTLYADCNNSLCLWVESAPFEVFHLNFSSEVFCLILEWALRCRFIFFWVKAG